MRARACLQLGEQVSHVGLHRLLREEEAVADLTIDESLRDQLEDFDLSGGRLLLELLERSSERDDLTRSARRPPLGDSLKRRGGALYRLRISLRSAASTTHVSVACGERITPPFEGCPSGPVRPGVPDDVNDQDGEETEQ